MIVGHGIDVVKKSRIQKIFSRYGKKFAYKILNTQEMNDFLNSKQKTAFLAKRFAAKEAIGKAIGRGILNGTLLKYICIANDKNGKPFIKSIDKKIINENEFDFFLSLSDEIEYAHASVIIARKSSVV